MKYKAFLALMFTICVLLAACAPNPSSELEAKTRAFTEKNGDYILQLMPTIQSWGERYDCIYFDINDHQKLKGNSRESNQWAIEIDEVEIQRFMSTGWIERVNFFEDGVIAFELGVYGFVTTPTTSIGFYYSPEDKPVWIYATGANWRENEYLYYPLTEHENGWVSDKTGLDISVSEVNGNKTYGKDEAVRKYELYTERLQEKLFLYKATY